MNRSIGFTSTYCGPVECRALQLLFTFFGSPWPLSLPLYFLKPLACVCVFAFVFVCVCVCVSDCVHACVCMCVYVPTSCYIVLTAVIPTARRTSSLLYTLRNQARKIPSTSCIILSPLPMDSTYVQLVFHLATHLGKLALTCSDLSL